MTERTLSRVDDFAQNPFPKTWEEWNGVGPKGAATFEQLGIFCPAQLLGKFLSIQKDTPDFYAFLSENGISQPRVLTLQLLGWCESHDVYVPSEFEG